MHKAFFEALLSLWQLMVLVVVVYSEVEPVASGISQQCYALLLKLSCGALPGAVMESMRWQTVVMVRAMHHVLSDARPVPAAGGMKTLHLRSAPQPVRIGDFETPQE